MDESAERITRSTDTATAPAGDRHGAGHLVWVTPSGTPRELSLDEAGVGTEPTCSGCGAEATGAVVVREHRACGHVGLDGFLAPMDVDATFRCPKCGDTAPTPYPPIAIVACCLACGDVLGGPPEHR